MPSDGKILTGAKDCFARRFPDVSEIEGLIPMILLQWKDVRFDRLLSRDSEKIVIRISFQGRVWGATLDPQNLYLLRLVRLNPKGEIISPPTLETLSPEMMDGYQESSRFSQYPESGRP